jgi:hypothetical protein
MNTYIVLVQTEDGESDWWKKGQYEAAASVDALVQAWSNTYMSPRRNGETTHRYRCAIVGPNAAWVEYDVTLTAQPSLVNVSSV